MKKKIKRTILMLLVALMSAASVWAENGPTSKQIWYTSNNGEITGYGFSGATSEYNENLGVWVATFENDVTSIGNDAFMTCRSLTSITLPAGVTSIGDNAFRNCSSLTSITIPEDVTSIGNYAFYFCSSLTSITIPEGVTSIGNYTFYNCSALTSITLPAGVTSIGNSAFSGCSALTSITLPAGVTSIGKYTFSGCSALTSITLPAGVTSIGNYTFSGCSALTSINLPEGVTSIGNYTFSGCSTLTSINLPEGVTSIGERAFKSCTALTSITLPEGVTSIGDFAFNGCTALTSITLPASLTSIGTETFMGCSVLTALVCESNEPPTLGTDAFKDCNALTEIIVNKEAVEAYKTKWNAYTDKIIDIDSYKAAALVEIETAMNAVDYLTDEDKAAIEEYKNIINSDAYPENVVTAKENALATISLRPTKNTALTDIYAAMKDETSNTFLNELVATEIANISKATDAATISTNKAAALAKLTDDVVATCKRVFGTLGTKQNGPAVKVTDKDGNEIILYNPKRVEYFKVR